MREARVGAVIPAMVRLSGFVIGAETTVFGRRPIPVPVDRHYLDDLSRSRQAAAGTHFASETAAFI
jgi:hypothetical protein